VLRFPSDWVQHFGVNLATALPPHLGARFRFYERIRPQPRFSLIVERLLASDPELVVHEVGHSERVVTAEGEYAAWVAIDGLREGCPVRRMIGAVFMHEFAAALDCIAIVPAHFGRVEHLSRELLRSTSFQMTDRPRVFFYQPPVGWQAIASGAAASWYPPDFPNDRSNLVVPPATTTTTSVDHARELSLAELRAGLDVQADAHDEITSLEGHRGITVRVHGHRAGLTETVHRELAAFVLGTRLYRFRLETTNNARLDELRAVLRAVATSFRPLPDVDEQRRGIAFDHTAGVAFDHWGD